MRRGSVRLRHRRARRPLLRWERLRPLLQRDHLRPLLRGDHLRPLLDCRR